MAAIDQLTEKQRLFVVEYAINMDRMKAIEKAGYQGTKQSKHNRSQRLLSDPKVQAALAEMGTKLDGAMLTVENLATQLSRAIYRNIAPYLDDQGYINCSIADLPEDIQQTIEGFDVENEYDFETGELKTQKVKLRFIPKIKALELAMKWRKMLQPDNQVNIQNNLNCDLSKLYEEPPKVNPVEQRIKENLDGNQREE
jgi:phage terminase small subunit